MANPTEHIGIHHCGEIAERQKWMYREQPIDDVGIDAHMEFTDATGKSKQLIALQVKTGNSWFKEKKDGCIIFREINERQYNYWTTNSLPCILVLYNPDDDMCIWQKLTSKTIEKTSGGVGKGYFVKVPINQQFIDDISNERLLAYSNLPEHITNYNFLLSQKRFMQIIQDGGSVKLHSTEWVNKSSGRGETELIVDDGNGIKKYSYPYWFPYTPYEMVFPKLFPWAEFSADKDFFEEYDRELWYDMNCNYDKAIDDVMVKGGAFDVFREKLDPMRSINPSGEVAEYMMVLSLNDLGKSFLYVDGFVSQYRPYADTRAKEEADDKEL